MADDRIRDWKTPVFFVLAVLLCCLVSYFAGRVKGRRIGWEKGAEAGYEAGYAAVHPSDTLVRVDTLLIDRPVPESSKPSGTETLLLGTIAELSARVDSLRAAKPDTAFVEVPVPIKVKTYKGEDYEAQVSGWHPSLDYIKTFPKTITITEWAEPEPPGRWSIGVTAGPGVFWNHADGVRPGVGAVLGVQFRF